MKTIDFKDYHLISQDAYVFMLNQGEIYMTSIREGIAKITTKLFWLFALESTIITGYVAFGAAQLANPSEISKPMGVLLIVGLLLCAVIVSSIVPCMNAMQIRDMPVSGDIPDEMIIEEFLTEDRMQYQLPAMAHVRIHSLSEMIRIAENKNKTIASQFKTALERFVAAMGFSIVAGVVSCILIAFS